MEVPRTPDFESNDLTVSFWMYLLEDSTNSYRTIFRKAQHAADMTPTLMMLPMDRRLHVRIATTGTVTTGFDSTAVIPLRRWTHVAVVIKGGAAMTLYVNGVKTAPSSAATATAPSAARPAAPPTRGTRARCCRTRDLSMWAGTPSCRASPCTWTT